MTSGWPHYYNSALARYVHNDRLASGAGVCWRLEGIDYYTCNAGGNLESIPSSYSRPGEFLYGAGLNDTIEDFFEAQGVNSLCGVDTSWLMVKHVDEVVSYASDGDHVFVADPNICWALLLWAHSLPGGPSAPMLSNMETSMDRQVRHVLGREFVYNSSNYHVRDLNFNTAWASVDLAGIRYDLGMKGPVTVDEDNPSDKLKTAGALVGFFDDDEVHYYKIVFTSSTNYKLQYWDDQCPSGKREKF